MIGGRIPMLKAFLFSLLVLSTIQACTEGADGCASCSGDTCAQCQEDSGYYLSGGVCCNTNEDSFPSLEDSCKSCSAVRPDCETCKYDPSQSEVVCQSCPADQFLNDQGGCGTCAEVVPGCIGCLYITFLQCIHCGAGFQGTTQSTACCDISQGLYADADNGCSLCSDAEEGCLSCVLDGDGVECQSCNTEQGYSLASSDSSCCSAKAGQYLQNGECKECSSAVTGCQECQLSQSTVSCTKCSEDYQLDEEGGCYQCPEGCSQCSMNGGSIECSSCEEGFQLYQTTCCEDGKYPNGQGSCEACTVFIPSCPSCEYTDSEVVCTDCSSIIDNCLTCLDSSTCTSCQDGHALTAPSTCTLCTEGQTLNADKDACVACSSIDANCLTCSAQSTCNSCSSGHQLNEAGSACSPCSDLHSECTQCSEGLCSSCQEGFLADGSTCTQCPTFCDYCSSVSQCEVCSIGFTSQDGECVQCMAGCTQCQASDISVCEDCANGYYEQDGKCHICPEGCFSCSDESTCEKCLPGFSLDANQCLACSGDSCQNCASGFYAEVNGEGEATGECKPCSTDYHCQECQGDAEQCTACETGYEILGLLCVHDTRIEFDLTLTNDLEEFKTKTQEFKAAFMQALDNPDYTDASLLIIKSLLSGSTKINAQLQVFSDSADSIYNKLSQFSGNSISAEFPVSSIENISAKNFTPPDSTEETNDPQEVDDSFPVYGIILLIVLPILAIVIIVGVCCLKQRTLTATGTGTGSSQTPLESGSSNMRSSGSSLQTDEAV